MLQTETLPVLMQQRSVGKSGEDFGGKVTLLRVKYLQKQGKDKQNTTRPVCGVWYFRDFEEK